MRPIAAPIKTPPTANRLKAGSVRWLMTCSATPLARMPGIIDSTVPTGA